MTTSTEITNPLDHSDKFLERAVSGTYEFVCDDTLRYNTLHDRDLTIPDVYAINDSLYGHFVQELIIDVMSRDSYESVGASSKEDLLQKLQEGMYDRYVPDLHAIKMYLHIHRLTFIDERGGVSNPAVKGVW